MLSAAEESGTPEPPVTNPALPANGNPIDIMLARKVAGWVLKNYARVYGTFDHEQPECQLVNALRMRWRNSKATTEGLRAAIQTLVELGAFHVYIRPPLPTSRNPREVQMLRPSKLGCQNAADSLDRARNYLPAEAVGRRTGPWVPNYLFHVLREHGVPAEDRQAAARYLVTALVKPHLTALGFAGPAPEAEPLYADPRPRPVVLTAKEKVIADMQSLVAAVEPPAPAAPTVTTLPAEASARLSAAGDAAMARWEATAATRATTPSS